MTNDQRLSAANAPSCTGCGALLQQERPDETGYIPPAALARTPAICQRCYKLKHYNVMSPADVSQDDFLRILSHVANEDGLVVHIVDLFDFEGTLIGGLQRFTGANPILLVVNKIDLLPKSVNVNRLVNWVQRQAKQNGLRVVDVVLCSARGKLGFDKVVEAISRHRTGKDVYVVGATNVGKSTLINRLIRDYSDLDAELTTSHYPGTTLNLVRIPLDDGKAIIDTPGIVYPHRLTERLSAQELAQVVPDKEIKPIVFQLNEQQTLFFGALARVDFLRGARQSFTCYLSNSLQIHRTKRERADSLYADHRGGLLAPPVQERLEAFPPLVKHPIRIAKGAASDVLISGLGWIRINSDAGAELEVYAPKGIKVAIRDALI